MAGIVEKLQKMWNPPDDEYDEYYEDEATEPTADSREEQPSARRSFSSSSSNRVVNINHARAGAQVVVFKPNSFRDDTNSIADEINQGHTVVVNFEETNAGEARFMVVLVAPDDKAPGWVVQAGASGARQVELIPLGAVEVPRDKALQFWTKAEGWSAPVSLGLVTPGQTLRVPAGGLPAVQPDQLFELTLEPRSGSPTGRPTGPVRYIGRAVKVM